VRIVCHPCRRPVPRVPEHGHACAPQARASPVGEGGLAGRVVANQKTSDPVPGRAHLLGTRQLLLRQRLRPRTRGLSTGSAATTKQHAQACKNAGARPAGRATAVAASARAPPARRGGLQRTTRRAGSAHLGERIVAREELRVRHEVSALHHHDLFVLVPVLAIVIDARGFDEDLLVHRARPRPLRRHPGRAVAASQASPLKTLVPSGVTWEAAKNRGSWECPTNLCKGCSARAGKTKTHRGAGPGGSPRSRKARAGPWSTSPAMFAVRARRRGRGPAQGCQGTRADPRAHTLTHTARSALAFAPLPADDGPSRCRTCAGWRRCQLPSRGCPATRRRSCRA